MAMAPEIIILFHNKLIFVAGFNCYIAQYQDVIYEDASSVKSISCMIYHTDYNISRNSDHFHVHSLRASTELCCHSIENYRGYTLAEKVQLLRPSFNSCLKCTHAHGSVLVKCFI